MHIYLSVMSTFNIYMDNTNQDVNQDSNQIKKDIVLRSAIQLAESLNVVAIVASKNILLPISTNIPIYYIPIKPKNLLTHVSPEKEIYDILIQKAIGSIEYIENRSFIQHMMEEFSSGVILGIIETKSSVAIIVHNLNENKFIKAIKSCEKKIDFECLKAILSIVFDLASSGREGSKIGTAFIIGDVEETMAKSHQIIMNPYKGHEIYECDILNNRNWESVKEFSQLDGIFIVSRDGIIHAAGRYIDVNSKDIQIDKGLGGRHVSAAAITKATNSIAITLSESGGVVRIYDNGKEIFFVDAG